MEPAQTVFKGPVILVGTDVLEDNARVLAVLVPAQFEAVTERLPETKPGKNSTTTDVLPWPLWMLAFAGAVQLYEVALATAAVVKVLVEAEHAPPVVPEILTGVPGLAE